MTDQQRSLFDLKIEISDAWRARLAPFIQLRNFLILFSFVFFLIAWNRGVSLIYGLVALLLGVMLVSYLTPYWSLRGVQVKRKKYLTAAVGESLSVELQVSRKHRGWGRMLEVVDAIPCALDDQQSPSVYLPKLTGTETVRYAVELNWRGLHRLGSLRVRSAYPLGVHQVSYELPDSCAEVMVYPSPQPIATLPLQRSACQAMRGDFLTATRGGCDQFVGLREYRFGDSMRHVHWGTSGYTGELRIKEYESYHSPLLKIVLDTHRQHNVGEDRYATFEYQVQIATNVARYCVDHDIDVALYASGKPDVALEAQCGELHYTNILETLAVIQADTDSHYGAYAQQLIQEQPEGSWLVFQNNETPELLSLVCHDALSQLIVIEFDSDSFRFPARGKKSSPSTLARYYVGRNDNLAELFRR